MKEDYLVLQQHKLSKQIKSLENVAYHEGNQGMNNSEITFAVQHLKEARMNLGVLLATVRGHDPWKSELDEVEA